VLKARAETQHSGVMESFLEEFGLSNPEGLALMCLAEALLRVPDADTADALIAEKIHRRMGRPQWQVGLAAGQRLDLGPDADRPDRAPPEDAADDPAASSAAWCAKRASR
jgi:hypothetical protein